MMPAEGGMSVGGASRGGAGEGGESGEGGDGGGIAGGAAVELCEALAVVRAKCQRCHSQPPENGAPVPFVTFEDFKAPYGSSGMTYGDAAIRAVELDIMPYVVLNDPPSNLMPPVQPLTSEEKATLLTWLQQGALPVGGTECP